MSSSKLASTLGIHLTTQIGDRVLTPAALCYAAYETVIKYCHSADTDITARHVPWIRGIADETQHVQLAEVVTPYARRMWTDVQNRDGGRVKFNYDHYLKLWALTEPRIREDFLLLDEAQDTTQLWRNLR